MRPQYTGQKGGNPGKRYSWIWIVLTGIGYALFLESYRIWMQSLRKGQPWITGGSLVLIALVVFSHFTLERFLLLIALGVPMMRLTRSLRQYSLRLFIPEQFIVVVIYL